MIIRLSSSLWFSLGWSVTQLPEPWCNPPSFCFGMAGHARWIVTGHCWCIVGGNPLPETLHGVNSGSNLLRCCHFPTKFVQNGLKEST